MAKFKISVALFLTLLVLIVVFQNTQPVETKCLFITFTMPRAALLAITMLIGVVVGMLLSLGVVKKFPKRK
jgi:putative membrane protein